MVALLVSLGQLVLGFVAILGVPLLVMLFLNARDRRHDLLAAIVLRELNRPALRGLTTLKIQGFWPPADKVTVQLWNCPRDQVWDIMERLTAKLPASVRIEVNGSTGNRAPERWTLSMTGHCPCRACWT